MTTKEDREAKTGAYLRQGSFVYTLMQRGWRRGEPVMVNEITIQVSVDPANGLDSQTVAGWVQDAMNGREALLSHIEGVEAESEELQKLAEEEGYEKAVQLIDLQTGGDGEYRFCTDGDPERHTPDAPAMIARISERFEGISSRAGAAEAQVAALRLRVGELEGALRPFEACASDYLDVAPDTLAVLHTHQLGELRRARTALSSLVEGDLASGDLAPSPADHDGIEGEPKWLRAGDLLYTLEQVGWRKGQPVEQNRLMVRIDGGPNATPAEKEALVQRVLAALSDGEGRVPSSTNEASQALGTSPLTSEPQEGGE